MTDFAEEAGFDPAHAAIAAVARGEPGCVSDRRQSYPQRLARVFAEQHRGIWPDQYGIDLVSRQFIPGSGHAGRPVTLEQRRPAILTCIKEPPWTQWAT